MYQREAISRIATVLAGAGGILLACLVAYGSLDGSKGVVGPVVVVSTLLAVGVGLIAHWFWARRTAAALCLLLAVFLPLGFINPFAAMDVEQPPSLFELLAWLVPVVLGLIALAWLIDPPRRAQPKDSLERLRGR